MLTALDRKTVRSDEGWIVRQSGSSSLVYSEANGQGLTIDLDLGTASCGRTLIILTHSDWNWTNPVGDRDISVALKKVIIERVKSALNILKYEVDSYTLEVLSGIQSHPLRITPLGGGRIQCRSEGPGPL